MFSSFDMYRLNLNNFQSLGDFTFDASCELLDYADSISRQKNHTQLIAQLTVRQSHELILQVSVQELSERASTFRSDRHFNFSTR